MHVYLGDSVLVAILCDYSGPRAVGGQFGHDLSGRVGGHRTGGEKTRRGASAERRRAIGRVGSNSAADPAFTRVACRSRGKRILRKGTILMAMSMAFVMPGLSDNGQCRNTHNGKLAKHIVFHRCRPLAIDLNSSDCVALIWSLLKAISESWSCKVVCFLSLMYLDANPKGG